ncbi:MAG: sodium:proton antiporter [Ignavibacteriae bacterium]|nr:sodium:proton antiporter [Ignavibacteriota bacterium]
MIIPFVLLLLAIAVMPFINRHWWERYYPAVSVALGLITIGYYVFGLDNTTRLLHTGFEYVSFIALIGSLFVVAGGIHIRIKGKSTPLRNVFLLAIGAVISNIVGTTGASMILIRPYIRVNRYRIKPFHVVFFIFVVSNMGGALTPIGDPPLFLGYLKGIPFFWVAEHLWYKWAIGMIGVLAIFYALDYLSFKQLPESAELEAEHEAEEGEVSGAQNVFFLAMILVAVFITDPPFVREALMLLAAVGSYYTTKKSIHEKNEFNFLPIKEVAILFLGIFATMIPALDWLELNATKIGIESAGQFYWATGSLSSVLDNAPTYLNFLSAAVGLFVNEEMVRQVMHLVQTHGSDITQVAGVHADEIKNTFATLMKYHGDLVAAGSVPKDDINVSYLIGNHNIYIQAISIAAVFFGAMTYIGNGPNFMVKSIAEQSGVKCPSFFGYVVKYSVPVLLPLFALIWWLFFI